MKINVKNNGKFVLSFNEYFISVNALKEFIKEKNKFINVDVLEDKIKNIYTELSILDINLSSSALGWFIVKHFKFKYKRPVRLEFWLERGYTINEFNAWNCNRKFGNQFGSKQINVEPIKTLNVGNINNFEYGKFIFKCDGKPKCRICNNDLILEPLIGRYLIKGCENSNCENSNCETHKNIQYDTIRRLAFLPLDILEKENKRINFDSKTNKEYWLLKGYSYDETLEKIKEVKNKVKLVNKQSSEHYMIIKDIIKEEANELLKTNSPWSINYWNKRGYTEKDAINKISELQTNNSEKFSNLRKTSPNLYSATTQAQIGYWLNKGFSQEDAKNKVSERQTTFSKEICIKKYGEEGGIKRFNERQKKWGVNYKKTNFSKISQILFWQLLENDTNLINKEIYFATYNNGIKDESGKNNEYVLNVNETHIKPDFFDKTTGSIIEFDGVYYHRTSPENDKREKDRDTMIHKSGYRILHINEVEYKSNPQEIINKCIEF